MKQSLTIENIKQSIGQPLFRQELAVESGMLHRYAEAVGVGNLHGQGDTTEVSATMLAMFGLGDITSALHEPCAVILHGSSDFESYLPVRVGDVITIVAAVTSIRERQSETGNTVFLVLQMDYTNQRGEGVALCKQLIIVQFGVAND